MVSGHCGAQLAAGPSVFVGGFEIRRRLGRLQSARRKCTTDEIESRLAKKGKDGSEQDDGSRGSHVASPRLCVNG